MRKQIIKLGTWDGKPIEWIVLKEDGFKALVISKFPLFTSAFNNSRNNGNQWGKSALRNYLNKEFWNKAFTAEEKKCVVNCQIKSPGVTKDNVFVLSTEEAETLLKQKDRIFGDGRCRCSNCSNCIGVSFNNNGGGVCWWLRSAYSGNECATIVDTEGDFYSSFVDRVRTVRPAMYIKW